MSNTWQYRKSLTLLVISRPTILALYKHKPDVAAAASIDLINRPASSSTARQTPASTTSSSRIASKQPMTAYLGNPAKAAAGTIKSEWLKLVSLPEPEEGVVLAELIKLVLFQYIMAAWTSLVGLGVNEKVSSRLPLVLSRIASLDDTVIAIIDGRELGRNAPLGPRYRTSTDYEHPFA
jgi:hypothetical protein